MPQKDTDYSNTLIYKISCKDKAVTDLYVGHTTNFSLRKSSHKQNCNSNPCKVYEIIRNNGGWSNWSMDIIAFYNCKDYTEARMKEQEYFLSLQANLNSVEPFPKKEEKRVSNRLTCAKCQYKCNKKSDFEKHTIEKHTINLILTVPTKYSCNLCEYNTPRCSQYDRHLNTTKHKKRQTSANLVKKALDHTNKYVCNTCSREYKERSGLWKHNKICINKPTIIHPQSSSNEITHIAPLICEMIKHNDELHQKLLNLYNNK